MKKLFILLLVLAAPYSHADVGGGSSGGGDSNVPYIFIDDSSHQPMIFCPGKGDYKCPQCFSNGIEVQELLNICTDNAGIIPRT